MINTSGLADFCHQALDANNRRLAGDPVQLGKFFRHYAGLQHTPNFKRTLDLVRSLGIVVEEGNYLGQGGANMKPNGVWYIHYAAQDPPAVQKFTIFHELFEVIRKSFAEMAPSYHPLPEIPKTKNSARKVAELAAERFAGAVLLPPKFFVSSLIATGCDIPKMAEGLELSHQCLLIGMEEHLADIPLVGALYDRHLPDGIRARSRTNDYMASLVVKTRLASTLKTLDWLQPEVALYENPLTGSLVCAALHASFPVFYQSTRGGDAAVLARPLFASGRAAYRVFFLALPEEKCSRFSPQLDTIQPLMVNEDSPCPAEYKCRIYHDCAWKKRRRIA